MLFAEEIANIATLRKLDAIQNRTDLMFPEKDEFDRLVLIPIRTIMNCRK